MGKIGEHRKEDKPLVLTIVPGCLASWNDPTALHAIGRIHFHTNDEYKVELAFNLIIQRLGTCGES